MLEARLAQYPLLASLPPTWLVVGGRGAGKTRLGAEWVNAVMRGLPPFAPPRQRLNRLALIGETLADVRDVMIEGPSGILRVSQPGRPRYEATRRRLLWESGAVATIFSSEDPESLRGHQFEAAWCDELGCPAVDKGPNQPNVFPDRKSIEGSVPHFSNGGRSDIAQRRFLEVHLDRWGTDSTGSEESGNPLSSVYGGRMVDTSRIYLWSWDARPFPAFPMRSDLWSDGVNWSRGHWLNGRLANPDLSSLVNAILVDHGQTPADVAGLEGTVEGYLLDGPTSAREALEPLADLFDIAVCENAGELIFRQSGAVASQARDIGELAFSEDGTLIETARIPDEELPAEALLTFRNSFIDYQAVSVRGTRLGAGGSRQHALSFPGSLDPGQGHALLDEWLKRTWSRRETATFFVEPRVDVAPGTVVRLPASGNASEFLVTGIEEGALRKVTARELVRSVPAPWNVVVPPLNAGPAMAAAGPPHALFLDLPAAIGSGEAMDQFRVAAWQKPWRRQGLSVSPEETGFAARATVAAPATLGRLTAALAPGFAGRLDRADTLGIELFGGNIAGVSMSQLLNGANAAAVRSASGSWEILQFATAEETAPGNWRLSDLLRGQLGTTDAMAAGAPAGADFVLLDDTVVPAGLQASEIGLLLNWRIGPVSGDAAAGFATSAHVGGVRALLPYAPVHLRGAWNGSDLAVSWIRCGRVDADRWEASEIPLAEDTERYQVSVAPADGAVLRSETVSGQSWLYSGAALAADFGAPPAAIDVTVRQFSAAVGWGLAASRRLALA